MIFQSLDFAVFLIIVFILYWSSNHKYQNAILLISSYFFYCYINPWFFFLIFFQSLISFYSARIIPTVDNNKWLVPFIAISFNLIILGFFKYFNFFISNIIFLFDSFEINTSLETLKILLPVGISFYTFQNISYLVDVYRKDIQPCKSPIDYFIFVSFFPQLVAGPIERAKRLLPQIGSKRYFSYKMFIGGFYLIIWGLFKKLVIADNVALISNKIFLLKDPDPFFIIVGTLAFCIQIFADFSAYTDIARGTAKLLGFNLIKNFDNPYFASNPSDFWKRWHISLSSWIRDYIYIPLGGSYCSTTRWLINITVTFSLMGLWHGASLNFIIWGLYHALLTIIYKLINYLVPSNFQNLHYSGIITIPLFFFFTNIGWLIFREQDLAFLIKYFGLFFNSSSYLNFGIALYLFITLILYSLPIIITSVYTYCVQRGKIEIKISESIIINFKIILCFLFFLAILILRSGEAVDFIYFQF